MSNVGLSVADLYNNSSPVPWCGHVPCLSPLTPAVLTYLDNCVCLSVGPVLHLVHLSTGAAHHVVPSPCRPDTWRITLLTSLAITPQRGTVPAAVLLKSKKRVAILIDSLTALGSTMEERLVKNRYNFVRNFWPCSSLFPTVIVPSVECRDFWFQWGIIV